MDINITTQGLQLLDQLDEPMDDFYKDLIERLTEDEAMKLSDLLDKMRG
jgi:DNA-binding MarR family transcriptional regulator